VLRVIVKADSVCTVTSPLGTDREPPSADSVSTVEVTETTVNVPVAAPVTLTIWPATKLLQVPAGAVIEVGVMLNVPVTLPSGAVLSVQAQLTGVSVAPGVRLIVPVYPSPDSESVTVRCMSCGIGFGPKLCREMVCGSPPYQTPSCEVSP
jgi:hypothetical protein